jgi:hypothetical protein
VQHGCRYSQTIFKTPALALLCVLNFPSVDEPCQGDFDEINKAFTERLQDLCNQSNDVMSLDVSQRAESNKFHIANKDKVAKLRIEAAKSLVRQDIAFKSTSC